MRCVAALGASMLLAACAGTGTGEPPATSPSHPLVTREVDVIVAGFEIHVRIVGDPRAGAPVVAIPGGFGLSQEYLAPLARLATPARAFVTFDPRGVGRSTRPASTNWTLAELAADTEAVRIAIGADKIHLVGHSYSGLIAMQYAIEHADHLASLVLIDGIPPTGAAMDQAFGRFRARQQALAAEGLVPAEMPKYDKADCREAMLAWTPVWFANPRHPRARDFPGMTCVDLDAELDVHDWDLRAALAGVRVRALVVEPAASPFGIEMSDAGARALSHARVEKKVLPACGHVPWLECEGPFFEALLAFLNRP